jgi:hypothetical protein
MTTHRSSLLLAMCFGIATASSIAHAQSSAPAAKRDKPNQPAAVQVPADANSEEERLALAIQIVSSLADEARSYKDESLKVKVQARAADVLWNLNKDRARSIFERAWDTAQIVDQDGRRAIEEKRRQFLAGASSIGFIPPPPNLRAEVLRLVSRHDRTLAEKFLAKMDEDDKRDEDKNKVKRSWDPTEPPEAVAKRLQLARELLEGGQLDAAVKLAQPGLNRVTSDGTIFLILLRLKNATLADQLFTALLNRTTADPLADATCVSLLASYALTPSVLVTFTRQGLLMNPWTDTLPVPQLSPALRNRFFESIAQVLMRPTSIADLELTSAGVRGTAFTIRRLLPLFEQTFPSLATGLQNRLDQLQQQTDIAISDQQRSFINTGFEPKKTEDESDDPLSQIERARSTRERNQLYAVAAHRAALKDDVKARELADKIEDEEYRKSVRNFVDVVLISKAKEKRDADKALQLTRTAELSHFQRVWAYTEIAALLGDSAQEQAINLITQAIDEAGRIERSSSESPEARTAIASTAMKLDQARTEDMLLDVVKAGNDSDTFTGEENSFTVDFRARSNIARVSISAPSISLANLFATLAKDDLRRAATIAEGIKAEAPRAVALLACASPVLTKNAIVKNK